MPYGTVDGRTAIGVEAAAEIFFDKHAKDLDAARGGAAGRPAPGAVAVQPVPQPAAPRSQRRNEVLAADGRERLHHAAPSADAASKDLGLKRGPRYTQRREPYFFDYVQEKLIERVRRGRRTAAAG